MLSLHNRIFVGARYSASDKYPFSLMPMHSHAPLQQYCYSSERIRMERILKIGVVLFSPPLPSTTQPP